MSAKDARAGPRKRRVPCWSYTAGAKGHMVTVYERVTEGPLQARCFDATLRNGRGGYRRVALGHRDHEKAKSYAHEQAAKLLEGRAELVEGTIARLLAEYKTHRTPHKSVEEQAEDARRITMWTCVLGAHKDPHLITRGEWERFIDARRTGARPCRVVLRFRRGGCGPGPQHQGSPARPHPFEPAGPSPLRRRRPCESR